VTALSDGGYVVTWMSYGQDGSNWGIYTQRYTAYGQAVGSETRVNTTIAGGQSQPDVAGLSDGGYVVTWISDAQDGSGSGIYAQRYDAAGKPIGGETRVNTTTAGYQLQPDTTGLPDGGYVVTWRTQDGSNFGVYAQRFDEEGHAVGSETRVNTTTGGEQYNAPQVAALSDGGYVVTWHWEVQDGSLDNVYAQRFDAYGHAVGSETRVNTTTLDTQFSSFVAGLSDGGYVVTWMSHGQDGGYDIYAQRYDAAGKPIGGETRVNTTTAGEQRVSAVAGLSDGGYVVTWMIWRRPDQYAPARASVIRSRSYAHVSRSM
jgi:hypothetical protein